MPIALQSPLQKQAEETPYPILQQQIEGIHQRLQAIDARRSGLHEQLEKLSVAAKHREQLLMATNAGSVPSNDTELVSLRDAHEATRTQLKSLPAEEEQLRAVARVLKQEREARAAKLDGLARSYASKQWQGQAEEQIATARRVVAQAVLAYAHKRSEHPEFVSVQVFIQNILLPEEIQSIYNQMVLGEREKAKRIVLKTHPTLGA